MVAADEAIENMTVSTSVKFQRSKRFLMFELQANNEKRHHGS